ncbi:MAG TPA: hypothetical protein VHJ20_02330 [Polyangia bacterium]|nr:hypothetical protein [Polyangia bacterium]
MMFWLAAAGLAQAGEKSNDATKSKEISTTSTFNKTFEWEDSVVGPKKKGIDHDKIAAMQEEGRREREAKRKEHAPAKVDHPVGVNDPASAKLPTMDIEKAAPAGSIHTGPKRAAYTPPRQHDEIDAVLAENRANEGNGNAGLDSVLSPKRSAPKKARHGRRRH